MGQISVFYFVSSEQRRLCGTGRKGAPLDFRAHQGRPSSGQGSWRAARKPQRGAYLRGLGNDVAVASIKSKADEYARSMQPMILAMKARGIKSANGIAKTLNDANIPTVRGKLWDVRSVLNLTTLVTRPLGRSTLIGLQGSRPRACQQVRELAISGDAYVENYLASALIDRDGHVFWHCRTAGRGPGIGSADSVATSQSTSLFVFTTREHTLK
jgi:hypothetical protein